MNHFVVEFKHALPAGHCKSIISQFEIDKNQHRGRTGSGVDLKKKNSHDLSISALPDWRENVEKINQIIFQGLLQYARAHPHLVCGAIASQYKDQKTGQLTEITADDIVKMTPDTLAQIVSRIYQIEPLNLQKYEQKQGGYPHFHSEHYPHPTDKTQRSLHRVLLVLIYLNDIAVGGETEFLYQQLKVAPTEGSLIMAPCGFTHTHCGHPSPEKDKYVIASWIGFKAAEQVYT